MPELMTSHLDDFTLLRHAAGELGGSDREAVGIHLEACGSCARRLEEIFELDAELQELARAGAFEPSTAASELPEGDPFRRRPDTSGETVSHPSLEISGFVQRASEEAARVRDRLLDSMREPNRAREVLSLSLGEPGARYGILYALQQAGREIASGPVSAQRLADVALERFRRTSAADQDPTAEAAVPLLLLVGQGHLLAGQACNWTREFERAKTHLQVAYRCFAATGGDEVGLAIVEHVEAQRRFLLDRGAEALILARRAKESFESLGMDELSAKADVAVGSALIKLGREDEAVPLLSAALKVFERRGAWTNYAGTLNTLATCLHNLDRLDEARREYARALRALPRDRDRSILAGIRYGLAEVLFSAERYREAAASFSRTARLYDDLGLLANALTASLWEIESWARAGELSRARHRLEIFQTRVHRHGILEPRVAREIEAALSGSNPDLSRFSELRRQTQTLVEDRLRQSSA